MFISFCGRQKSVSWLCYLTFCAERQLKCCIGGATVALNMRELVVVTASNILPRASCFLHEFQCTERQYVTEVERQCRTQAIRVKFYPGAYLEM